MAVHTAARKPSHSTAKPKLKIYSQPERSRPSLIVTRQEFLRLPLSQRRRILRAQALSARAYYAESTEWREWEAADLISRTHD